jgi:hypothetical protein
MDKIPDHTMVENKGIGGEKPGMGARLCGIFCKCFCITPGKDLSEEPVYHA